MRPFCQTCGKEQPANTGPEWWDNAYCCASCGAGYDAFEKAFAEGRIEFDIPKSPKVGDVKFDTTIKPEK